METVIGYIVKRILDCIAFVICLSAQAFIVKITWNSFAVEVFGAKPLTFTLACSGLLLLFNVVGLCRGAVNSFKDWYK